MPSFALPRKILVLITCAVLFWALALAGIWLLPDKAEIFAVGAAMVVSFVTMRLYTEHRVDERVRRTMAEADRRERELIRTIAHLTDKAPTGPLRAVS